nr:unnamed protein product [Callosobruchus chinensis]
MVAAEQPRRQGRAFRGAVAVRSGAQALRTGQGAGAAVPHGSRCYAARAASRTSRSRHVSAGVWEPQVELLQCRQCPISHPGSYQG